jgi:D-alanine-D-alanine ligase
MLRIVVLLGGKSPEREVSLISGAAVAKQLRLNGHEVLELDPADYQYGYELLSAIINKHTDVVFIGLHGGDGENGVLQAMLQGSGIRYTGSGFKASAVAMDKLLSKFIAAQAEVPCPDYLILSKTNHINGLTGSYNECRRLFSASNPNPELVIKPADGGSSVGVHIVKNEAEWHQALEDAFKYSDKVMAEEYIEGRELTVTILDGTALPVVEIKPHNGFYDYPNKYTAGNTTYVAPAELDDKEADKVRDFALRIWQAMECSGYARIDFRYNGRQFYFLEVNTLPGMTPLSLTPMAAKAVGIGFGELLERIITAIPPQV